MDIKGILSGRINIKEIKEIVSLVEGNHNGGIDEIRRLLEESEDKRVSDNASWVLTHLQPQDKKQFLGSHKDYFIDLSMKTDSETKKRLLLNIINELGFKEEEVRTDFLDFCLSAIPDCGTAVGIRALCIYLAYEQCKFFPELCNELKELLTLMDDNLLKAGLKNTKKKILEKIKKTPK